MRSFTLALALCMLVPDAGQALTLVLVRHGQKAAGDDPPLTPVGAEWARRLATLFAGRAPQAIFVTDTRRSAETAAPTAAAAGLTPQVRSRKDAAAHVAALAAELRARPATDLVLAVEHSDTIPLLLGVLGEGKPPTLADGQYGDVFVVTLDGAAPPVVLRLGLPPEPAR